MKLFHVTPQENYASILVHGIDPRVKYPQRLDPTSFWVTAGALDWAIAHMSARHQVFADDLFIFHANTEIGASRFFDKGLYRVRKPVPYSQISGRLPASEYINRRRLQLEMVDFDAALFNPNADSLFFTG